MKCEDKEAVAVMSLSRTGFAQNRIVSYILYSIIARYSNRIILHEMKILLGIRGNIAINETCINQERRRLFQGTYKNIDCA